MPQETNLNVAPYYDDFNADDKYYKIAESFKEELKENK